MKSIVRTAILLAVCAALPTGPALASSCVDPLTVPIRFKPGSSCWHYEGKATHFAGAFRGGQRMTVSMFGEAEFMTPSGGTRSSWDPRSPEIEGPAGFATSGEGGKLEARLPRSGLYTVGFSPCAMWHGRGTVDICTG